MDAVAPTLLSVRRTDRDKHGILIHGHLLEISITGGDGKFLLDERTLRRLSKWLAEGLPTPELGYERIVALPPSLPMVSAEGDVS